MLPQDNPKSSKQRKATQSLRDIGAVPKPAPPADTGSVSSGGYVENFYESIKRFVWMPFESIKAAAVAMQELAQPHNAKFMLKNPSILVKGQLETTKQLAKAFASPVTNVYGLLTGTIKPKEYFYDDPLMPVIDLMSAISMGSAAAARGAKLGYSSGAITGRQAVTILRKSKALGAIPGKIMTGALELPLKAVGINPKHRYLLTRHAREETAIANETLHNLFKEVDAKVSVLSEAERVALDEFIELGGSKRALAARPKVAEAYKVWDEFLTAREKILGHGDGGYRLLDAERQHGAVVKKYAARKGISVAEASKELDAMGVSPDFLRPRYKPAVFEKEVSLKDILAMPDEVRAGKVGFLESYRGGSGIADPVVWMKRGMEEFVNVQKNLRLIDRAKAAGLLKGVKSGQVNKNMLVADGVYKKYLEDATRAQATVRDALVRKHGVPEATRLLLEDPVTQKYVGTIRTLAAESPTVASYFKWTLTRPSGRLGAFLRVYDKFIIAPFKMAATVFNPRWYTGNIVGDAVLATMASEYGLSWPMLKKMLDKLPPELRVGGKYISSETGATALGRLGDRLSQIVQSADDLVRRNIWTTQVARAFKGAAAKFERSGQSIQQFLETVGQSPSKLADIQVAMQKLDQAIMARVPRARAINTMIERLEKKRLVMLDDLTVRRRRFDERNAAELAKLNERLELVSQKRDALKWAVKKGQIKAKTLRAKKETKLGIPEEYQKHLPEVGDFPISSDARLQAIARLEEEISTIKANVESIGDFPLASNLDYDALVTKIDILREQKAQIAAELRERMVHSGHLDAQLPELRKYSDLSRQAVDHANIFLGEYLALGPIEQQVFRRVVPFYAWIKSMNKLAFSMPFLMPKTTLLWHRFASATLATMDDSERPQWMAPYIPTHIRSDGGTLAVSIRGWSPFGSVGSTSFGGVPIPKMLAFWQHNPIISFGYRSAGGRDEYYWSPPPSSDEPLVSIADGETYRLNQHGEFEKTVTQPGMIKNLAHMFPAVQFIHQLISDHDVRKGPALKPDGTPMFPMDMYQKLAQLIGAKVIYKDRDEAIRQERAKVSMILRGLQKQYRKAGPDRRPYIKQIFMDIRARGTLPRLDAK